MPVLDEPPTDLEEESRPTDDVRNIQATIDVLKSPLFSALVEIRSNYAEVGNPT